ncbi:hypothetical protein KM043_009575 [Ampulex compressa]|nr:hypothetical protein KM043_009575 [Ampulex compressa]
MPLESGSPGPLPLFCASIEARSEEFRGGGRLVAPGYAASIAPRGLCKAAHPHGGEERARTSPGGERHRRKEGRGGAGGGRETEGATRSAARQVGARQGRLGPPDWERALGCSEGECRTDGSPIVEVVSRSPEEGTLEDRAVDGSMMAACARR